jgi:predicted O-linked N-acetylglucosamine transferase (SPINDLY family)
MRKMCEVGLQEFVAKSEEEYVEIALRWGRDLEVLAQVRRELGQRMQAAPSSNAADCTRALESAYREMWRTWCARQTV